MLENRSDRLAAKLRKLVVSIFFLFIAFVFPSVGFTSELIYQPSDSYSMYDQSTNLFVAPYCQWLGDSSFSACQVATGGIMPFTPSSTAILGSVQIAIMQQNADDTITALLHE